MDPPSIRFPVPLTDAWFEARASGVRLLIATDRAHGLDRFEVKLVCGGLLGFRAVGDIKGRRVFEATQCRPECDPAPFEPVPVWPLSGPFRTGPQDVS
jgi:hypothetical protein